MTELEKCRCRHSPTCKNWQMNEVNQKRRLTHLLINLDETECHHEILDSRLTHTADLGLQRSFRIPAVRSSCRVFYEWMSAGRDKWSLRPSSGDRVELFLILDLARGSFQRYVRCIGYLGLDREKRQNQQAFSRPFSSTTPTANLM